MTEDKDSQISWVLLHQLSAGHKLAFVACAPDRADLKLVVDPRRALSSASLSQRSVQCVLKCLPCEVIEALTAWRMESARRA